MLSVRLSWNAGSLLNRTEALRTTKMATRTPEIKRFDEQDKNRELIMSTRRFRAKVSCFPFKLILTLPHLYC